MFSHAQRSNQIIHSRGAAVSRDERGARRQGAGTMSNNCSAAASRETAAYGQGAGSLTPHRAWRSS
eukprot:11565240-Prorocentrum_lima.AAC.1